MSGRTSFTLTLTANGQQVSLRGLETMGKKHHPTGSQCLLGLDQYLKALKPGQIPDAIEIQVEGNGVLIAPRYWLQDQASACLFIPRQFIDVWAIFFAKASQGNGHITLLELREELERLGISIKSDYLKLILTSHPGIGLNKETAFPLDTTTDTVSKVTAAIEKYGREYVIDQMRRLSMRTPLERKSIAPETVKPALSVKAICRATNVPEPTVLKMFHQQHPTFVAVSKEARGLCLYHATSPEVINLIPVPLNPRSKKPKFPWAFAAYWLTFSRDELSGLWSTAAESQRLMMAQGNFLFQLQIVHRMLNDPLFARYITRRDNKGKIQFQLARGPLQQWKKELASLGIQKPFPDSETTLLVQA